MKRVVAKVAVVGSGISGSVCASTLARNGFSVTVFDSGRGPGGRMSQRREITEDGKELFFDHGAPFFTISNSEVISLVHEWEAKALVAEWKGDFGSFDYTTAKFVDVEKCVETKFGTTVGKLDWLEDKKVWQLTALDGQTLGHFDGVVASDKNIVSPRFTSVTGRLPPRGTTLAPELAIKLQEVSSVPCFTLMLAFAEPLSLIPVQGFSFKNSEVLSQAFCDSSKPGRLGTSECWVLHSTAEYARRIIDQSGLQKPSSSLLSKVAEELLKEFQGTELNIPRPFFLKAHRWGSAFPSVFVAKDEKCLWDIGKRLVICGDFCISPDVEGAILSGIAASQKLLDNFSCLETTEDGKQLFFDHGAPFFTISNSEVISLVHEWEAKALVAEWKGDFGSFDYTTAKFVDVEKNGMKKYVGISGMNSICRALCQEHGVETKFGTTVGKLDWLEDKKVWQLTALDGQTLGHFDSVVASDKNIVSPRFTSVTGRSPPLDMTLAPELAIKVQEVSSVPCFTLMLAFAEPLSLIPVQGFSFKNSEVLSQAFCDSSKPERLGTSECWVLHSTAEYARRIIDQSGLQKPSSSLLSKVAEELLKEFQGTELNIPRPFFLKAHRWGSAFPSVFVAKDEKCLWDVGKRLVICGDFCISPDVEGAILSGIAASQKLLDNLSCL